MARITVDDCLEHVTNRFELVLIAAELTRQFEHGTREPQVSWDNDKATVVALRQIAQGKYSYDEYIKDLREANQ